MHSVVEEAEGRHITNQGMLLQLKGLIEGFYLGYYMLDKIKFQPPEEESIEDEVSHEIQSFALSTFNSAKRLRFADAIRKHTQIAIGSRSTTNLKDFVDGLEAKIADMREFIMLLGSYPRLPRRTEDIAKFGTSQPIRLKRLSQQEYWYFFKALAFGSMDPDEHPKLASLGLQVADVMNGSFIGATVKLTWFMILGWLALHKVSYQNVRHGKCYWVLIFLSKISLMCWYGNLAFHLTVPT
ncbi:hypothetical protein E2562_031870 [Oryza meyeriana var. granulata]|uniref:Uncharacterized protein n=1 Tax=Oryza meyeriana var. granulata TaxID=110450 RepID=A0A6G1CJV6_9ORYZ|nr:hypothetical protein E2562_031870 [Oryza meyeriana var. granulata]